jgi:excisionase family DNA binding protein
MRLYKKIVFFAFFLSTLSLDINWRALKMQYKYLLSSSEFAEAIGISKPTLARGVRDGRFPSLKLGRRRMFAASLPEQLEQKALDPNHERAQIKVTYEHA